MVALKINSSRHDKFLPSLLRQLIKEQSNYSMTAIDKIDDLINWVNLTQNKEIERKLWIGKQNNQSHCFKTKTAQVAPFN